MKQHELNAAGLLCGQSMSYTRNVVPNRWSSRLTIKEALGQTDLTSRSVLVTGGAGYIGSHTCKCLSECGYKPVAYDNLSAGNRDAVRWGPLVEGDLADVSLLAETFLRYRIFAVIHFAASAYVGESTANPRKYFENNLVKTLSLLNCMLDRGVRQMVFSSTCATYGPPRSLPISESHLQEPINPYGESKLAVEKILKWYGAAYGFQSVTLRYFNVAGADPSGELGEHHEPETHLIPLAIQAALNVSRPLAIFGSDYPTKDGTAVRDYVHVSDVASAHTRALQFLRGTNENCAFNLGTGAGHSVADIVNMVQVVTGRPVPVERLPRRAGDPAELVADPSQARERLRWSPEHSDLRNIVATAYNWNQKCAKAAGSSS